MKKTKIDWADSTWNPVTGCLHGCEYCYARGIANRFGGAWRPDDEPIDKSWRKSWRLGMTEDAVLMGDYANHANGGLHMLDDVFYSYPCYPTVKTHENDPARKKAAYPYYFDPTFHRYKLDEPQRWKKPRTIFVCSMADLFGDWVPDAWIQEVFQACDNAPWHRYLFLTKNPKRLCKMANAYVIREWNAEHQKPHKQTAEYEGVLPLPVHDNWWFGSSLDNANARRFQGGFTWNTFTSIEPLTEYMDMGLGSFGSDKWTIIGAETGNRKGKVIPQREWVENIVEAASITGVKVFMKESLHGLMGSDFRQEFPWDGEN